jgi:uncharacterized alkaline shock family protein YloU
VAQPDLKANLPGRELEGDVTVADGVIAKLAGRAALLTYGVVDLSRSWLSGVTRLLGYQLAGAVEVDAHESHADISLRVVIERGLNLAEVTRTLEEQVRFEVERVAGVRVGEVHVRVQDVRR